MTDDFSPELEGERLADGSFERGDRETIDGTGIGLATVARSMPPIGGHCGVESSLGVGARSQLDRELN